MVTRFTYGSAWATAGALAVAGIGCGDRAVIRVRAERGRFAPGDSVAVVAANVSRRREIAWVNLCPWRLERADGAAWTVVARSPAPGTACALAPLTLFPGEQATGALRLPARLSRGRYRVTFPWVTRERGVPLAEADRQTATFELR